MRSQTPIPQGKYRPALRNGNAIYTAGMTPRRNGVLVMTGQVGPDTPLETLAPAVAQAAQNALAAAQGALEAGERLLGLLSLTVYVNAPAGFQGHSRVADLASQWFYEQLGEGAICPRTAVGISSLPGDAPVELQTIFLWG